MSNPKLYWPGNPRLVMRERFQCLSLLLSFDRLGSLSVLRDKNRLLSFSSRFLCINPIQPATLIVPLVQEGRFFLRFEVSRCSRNLAAAANSQISARVTKHDEGREPMKL